MSAFTFLTPKKAFNDGGWSRLVDIDGRSYRCRVERGERVRIAYKPRGQNIGFRWYGSVWRMSDGCRLWIDQVPGSIGCRGLLKDAGLIQ